MRTTRVTVRRIVGIVGGAIVLILAILVFVGGDLYHNLPDGPLQYPEGCAAFGLSDARCDFAVARTRESLGLGPGDVERIEMLGNPVCDAGVGSECRWLGAFLMRLRFFKVDQQVVEQNVLCLGVAVGNFLCTDPDPRISSPTIDGYRDIPAGATPLPTIDPAAEAAAKPLRPNELHIPIDHTGRFEFELGEAILPNGVLREALIYGFVTRKGAIVSRGHGADLGSAGIRLVVESTDPDRPAFTNLYEHGWWPGVERVRVKLIFDVVSFEAGAMVHVEGVVVR